MKDLIETAQEILSLLNKGENLDNIIRAKHITEVLFKNLDSKETDLLYKDDKDTPFWQR